MIKITEIRVNQKKNLGNYESQDLGLTIVVGEGEDPNTAIDEAFKILDFKLNESERENKSNTGFTYASRDTRRVKST